MTSFGWTFGAVVGVGVLWLIMIIRLVYTADRDLRRQEKLTEEEILRRRYDRFSL